MKPWYQFETYEGDDDFLVDRIRELPLPDDEITRLLLSRNIPELWQLVNQSYIEARQMTNEDGSERTVVVNKYAEDYDVDIMRPTIWGNPFRIGLDGTREEVIQKYKERMAGLPHLIELARKKLKGKRLGCCCKPQTCHGDVLVEFIEDEGRDKDKDEEKR